MVAIASLRRWCAHALWAQREDSRQRVLAAVFAMQIAVACTEPNAFVDLAERRHGDAPTEVPHTVYAPLAVITCARRCKFH